MSDTTWLNSEQAALMMGISGGSLATYRQKNRPRIPYKRENGRVYYKLEDIEEYVKSRNIFGDD